MKLISIEWYGASGVHRMVIVVEIMSWSLGIFELIIFTDKRIHVFNLQSSWNKFTQLTLGEEIIMRSNHPTL